jgi:hypothetical protein
VFASSFDISNAGLIPLNDVGVSLALGEIYLNAPDANTAPQHFTKTSPKLAYGPWQHHRLTMDERFTIRLKDFINANATAADIAITISYKPSFLPITREKMFRFVTAKEETGNVSWRSLPVE